jgi:hypothetical protein
MSEMKCWRCNSITIQTGYYTYQDTVTIEVMKWPKCYCEPGWCECEPYMGLEDRTFTARTFIFKCPACGLQFQTDTYGIGLAEIDQDKIPEQQEDVYGDFHRIAPDPVIKGAKP